MSEVNNSLPASKADLLARIQHARAALQESLGTLTRDQMLRPGAEGWSIKDHLAHLVAWQQIMLGREFAGKSFGEAAGMDATTATATAHMSAETGINDYLYARDQDLPLEAVLERFERSYRQLLEAVAAVDEAALHGAGKNQGKTLVEAVADDSYAHDQEHHRYIRQIAGLPDQNGPA